MIRNLWMLMAVALVGSGCGRLDLDADHGGDELDLMSSESALTSDQVATDEAASSGDCTALTPEQLAARAAERAPQRFSPSSCVQATATGATVTYVMKDCSGRYGYLQATGTFTSTFSRAGQGALQLVVAGSGLSANGATLDVNATAVCTRVGDARVFAVKSDVTGTGPRGRPLHHVGDYTVKHTIGTQCVGVDGTWTNTSGPFQRVTTVTGLSRCAGSCPAAGGKIDILTARGTTTKVTFDGTAVASWSTGSRSGTLDLRCAAP